MENLGAVESQPRKTGEKEEMKIKTARMKPIIKTDIKGQLFIVGYERKSRSRKSGSMMLKKPIAIRIVRPKEEAK